MSESKVVIYKFELWSNTFDSCIDICVYACSLSDAETQLRFILGDVLASKCNFIRISE